VNTSPAGYYSAASLPPGLYSIRATASSYQAQESFGLELAVAGTREVNFRLRPLSDVWESGEQRSVFLPGTRSLVTFYGPDVDASRTSYLQSNRGRRGSLEATVSEVIDPLEIRELPLAGRDVYTVLVTQPGVTADSATARGLGLAANGQRPSASNFYLDGVQNNNFLITGPQVSVAPEPVQEYRVSTNNFSAEYGGASGFVANAVTRAGTNSWHGLGYFYLKHHWLNANGFQQNRLGISKPFQQDNQPGFQVGGPLIRNRLFFSSALESLRGRTQSDPFTAEFPSRLAVNAFMLPTSLARGLMTRFAPPVLTGDTALTTPVVLRPPNTLKRLVVLERGDLLLKGGRHRVMGRVSAATINRPDFFWSPYPDFVSALRNQDFGFVLSIQNAFRPGLTHEARGSVSGNQLWWHRPHPEIPTLQSSDQVLLPGSPLAYEYRNRNRTTEFQDNLTWIRGVHTLRFGGAVLFRGLNGHLTAARDGLYGFPTILDFALDSPAFVYLPLDRAVLPARQIPGYGRSYRQRQFSLFAQNAHRVSPRLTVNYGLRYESFGVPVNRGAVKDLLPVPGDGPSFNERTAALRFPAAAGDQRMHDGDRNDWAFRFGVSRGFGSGTVLRAAYGVFYDRPFDNSWQNLRNNRLQLAQFPINTFTADFLEPLAQALPRYRNQGFAGGFPSLTLFQPGFRTAYVHSYFTGIQHRLGDSWTFSLTGSGSLGRKLITTDLINRDTRLLPDLQNIAYRSNQGLSSFHGLSLSARYGSGERRLHAAYTWSHVIDNQSEPLSGDFFDLGFTGSGGGSRRSGVAAFTRLGDSRGDRGDSDFDQRHNFVVYSVIPLPGPRFLSGWRFSQLAAFRTGYPFSVLTGGAYYQRAALVPGATAVADAATSGGKRLLNRAAFTSGPAATGRNAFRGPGLFNVDLSVARRIGLRWLGEAAALTLRADAFNFFNHANLNNPAALLTDQEFGIARFGRTGRDSGFPGQAPLAETGRQIQLLVRFEF